MRLLSMFTAFLVFLLSFCTPELCGVCARAKWVAACRRSWSRWYTLQVRSCRSSVIWRGDWICMQHVCIIISAFARRVLQVNSVCDLTAPVEARKCSLLNLHGLHHPRIPSDAGGIFSLTPLTRTAGPRGCRVRGRSSPSKTLDFLDVMFELLPHCCF